MLMDYIDIFNRSDIKNIIVNIISSSLTYILSLLGITFYFLYKGIVTRQYFNKNIQEYRNSILILKNSLLNRLNYIETNDINHILNSNKVSLVGKAGSGKTTLLNQIFIKENSIYINLEDIHSEDIKNLDTFYNLILNNVYINKWEEIDKKYLCKKIENGELRLLIDSFEQLDKDKKIDFKQILRFLIRLKNVKFLIAGRNLDYLSEELSKINKYEYNSISMNELSDEDIKLALSQIKYKNIQYSILSLKNTNKKIYNLIKKPLYLNILIQVLDNNPNFKIDLLQKKNDFFNILSENLFFGKIENIDLTIINEILKIISYFEITNIYNNSQLLENIAKILQKYNIHYYSSVSIINKFEKLGIILKEDSYIKDKERYKFFHSSYRDYYLAQGMKENDILDNYIKNPKKWEEVLIMFSNNVSNKDKFFSKLIKNNYLEILLASIFEIGEEFKLLRKDIQWEILSIFREISISNSNNDNIISLLGTHILLETNFGNRLFNMLEAEFSKKNNEEYDDKRNIENIVVLLAKRPSINIANLLLNFTIKVYRYNKFKSNIKNKNIEVLITFLINMDNITIKILSRRIKNIVKFKDYDKYYRHQLLKIFLTYLLIPIYEKRNNNNNSHEDIKEIVSFLLWNKDFEEEFIADGVGINILNFFNEEYELSDKDINNKLISLTWIWRPFYSSNNKILNLGRFSYLFYIVINKDFLKDKEFYAKDLSFNLKIILPILFIQLKYKIKIPKQTTFNKIINFYKSEMNIDFNKDINGRTDILLNELNVNKSWKKIFYLIGAKCQKELFLRISYRDFSTLSKNNWNKKDLLMINTYSFEKSLFYKSVMFITAILTLLSFIFTILLFKNEDNILLIMFYIISEFFIISGWLLFWKNPLKLKSIQNTKVNYLDIFLSMPSILLVSPFISSIARVIPLLLITSKNKELKLKIEELIFKYISIFQYPIFLFIQIYFTLYILLTYERLLSLFLSFIIIFSFSLIIFLLFKIGIEKEKHSNYFLSGIFYNGSDYNNK